MSLKKLLFISLVLLCGQLLFAHNNHDAKIELTPNKGQWEPHILFQASIPNGKLYIEKNKLTFLQYSPEDISRIHDIHHNYITNPKPEDFVVNCHAYQMVFNNSNPQPIAVGKHTKPNYSNFFIGSDQSKWATKVPNYETVILQNIYPEIDLRITSQGTDLKYEFIVKPGGNPENISYSFEGLDQIENQHNRLILTTSLGKIIDDKPVSYQIGNHDIPTHYLLDDNQVKFNIKSYDQSQDLIIDPLLVFASFSGATSDNWGFTATFDELGHLYAGGVAFGTGYPTTIGAFQTTFGGGSSSQYNIGCDISLSKFASNGSTLVYSTFVGGSSNECPHSLVVDNNNELYLMATTSSFNYPTSIGCYDSTFGGGTPYTSSGINYANGTDIVITKFKEDGSDIVGSTYVGGSANDGLNVSTLKYNYADDFRGEIVTSGGGCIVASTTFSNDFPVTAGAAQDTLTGGQDGCVFRLSGDLTNLEWSTYIGGSDNDAAYGLQLNQFGEAYISGGTKSSDFPTTTGTIHETFQGITDGFLTKISNSGSLFEYSTYLGTTEHDQSYFVQLDSVDNVYVVGQTEGNYPVQPASVYANPNSGQFIHKLNPELNNTIFSTVVGSGNGEVNIALSAFLVNTCAQIYISGWGGVVNASNNGPSASSTTGLPVTSDAFQASTDGSDFYLMVLGQDAQSLQYATFFGGTSNEHVDGGTSRFDKNGIVYQAVCGGCGGSSSFPVTSGAWSETNNSANCNIASIKFDLSIMSASASIPEPELCAPASATFQNLSNGGTSYFWDFGDGNTSTEHSPTHNYNDTGTFVVTLIVYDPASCITSDTSSVEIVIAEAPELSVNSNVGACLGDSVQLFASGTPGYIWSPSAGLNDNGISNPKAIVENDIVYTVTGINHCGTDQESVTVTAYLDNTASGPDTATCIGGSVPISAYGGVSYSWSPTTYVTNPNSSTTNAHPTNTTNFNVSITDANGCVWEQTVEVYVDTALPIAIITGDSLICIGDTIHLAATGGPFYNWNSDDVFNLIDSASLWSTPLNDATFNVTVTNGCGDDTDERTVYVSYGPDLQVTPTAQVCPGNTVQLFATGSPSYSWSPSTGLSNTSVANPTATVNNDIFYKVVGTDNCGSRADTVFVFVYKDSTTVIGDTAICLGQSISLGASGGKGFNWDPPGTLNNPNSPAPTASPSETTTYTVTITDYNNCPWSKNVLVQVDDNLPLAEVSNDTIICYGDTVVLQASGGMFFEWETDAPVNTKDSALIITVPNKTSNYVVSVTNGCGRDVNSVQIQVNRIIPNVIPDTAACEGDSLQLYASGGLVYIWDPPELLDDFGSPTPNLLVEEETRFYVKLVDDMQCEAMDSVLVSTLPNAYVDAGEDKVVEFGNYVELFPTGDGVSYQWSPSEFTDCDTCFYPNVNPEETMYFHITLTDEHGCEASDSVLVYVTGSIYVANTFTPDGDMINDIFYAHGEEIATFKMYIFDRWGDIIFESSNIEEGWNGKINGTGELCPTGTYIWLIEYTETEGREGRMVGHVNLLK